MRENERALISIVSELTRTNEFFERTLDNFRNNFQLNRCADEGSQAFPR